MGCNLLDFVNFQKREEAQNKLIKQKDPTYTSGDICDKSETIATEDLIN